MDEFLDRVEVDAVNAEEVGGQRDLSNGPLPELVADDVTAGQEAEERDSVARLEVVLQSKENKRFIKRR